MFYRVKIKLPKTKIKQYAEPVPISVSELSDSDFIELVKKYSNHKDLANDIKGNRLKSNNQKLVWSPSPNQIGMLTQYYLGNTLRLANEQEIPGNQFADVIDGSNIIHFYSNRNSKNAILQAYSTLKINNNGRFIYRINNKNIEYTEPFNQEYISQFCSPEMFTEILRDIYKDRKTPLSRPEYERMGNSYYLNGILYKLPLKIDDPSKSKFRDVFYRVQQYFFPVIQTEDLTPDALKAFLTEFSKATNEEYEYQRKKCPSFFDNSIETFYFTFEDINYRLYEYDRFLKKSPQEVLEVWKQAVKLRESENSIADQSLREIQQDETINWPEGIVFDTQYSSEDFITFAKDYLNKYNKDQIMTLIDAIKLNNDGNVLVDESNEIYYFNLSTDFFGFNSDIQKAHEDNILKKKEFQFKLFKNNNNWWCTINKVSKTKVDSETIQLFPRKSDPNQYSLDAVIVTNGKLSHIIEYDGSDHFGLRKNPSLDGGAETTTNSFLNRMLADQLKSAYARSLNIPIIRVPDYNRYTKSQIWKDAFKQFILEKLNMIQTTSETINPLVKAAYKIKKMIK